MSSGGIYPCFGILHCSEMQELKKTNSNFLIKKKPALATLPGFVYQNVYHILTYKAMSFYEGQINKQCC